MLVYCHCLAETLSEDEDYAPEAEGDSISIAALPDYTECGSDFIPTPGGPFSALTPSMWPQDIFSRLSNPVSKTTNFEI